MEASKSKRGTLMTMKSILLTALLFVLPHCSNLSPKKSFESVQRQSKHRIHAEPLWQHEPDMKAANSAIKQGITIQKAIAIGLENNAQLQAKFEDLGIKKADLVQAGFFTNPQLFSVFRIPRDNDEIRTNIETDVLFMISDLWQVPLRKKVAQDDLEVKTYEIVTDILQLRKNIQLAYIACVHNQEVFETVKEISSVVDALKERIAYRYQFGYATKLDKYVAASKAAEWHAKKESANIAVKTAHIALHEIIGGYISPNTIELLDTIPLEKLSRSQKELEEFAFSSHPLLLIQTSKMARAKHSESYETSRIFDDAQFGISYKRDFGPGVSGVGPAFGIRLPFFDRNTGNIERARREYKQAKKELYAQKLEILKSITTSYLQYDAHLNQIERYEKEVLPPVTKAIEFSKEFFDRMQMSLIVFLQTQIDLYQQKLTLLDLQYSALENYVELEFAAGAQLQTIDQIL